MSETHYKIMGALTVLPEVEKVHIWDFIQSLFAKNESLTMDEVIAIEGYLAGKPEYTESVSFEEASKRWLADD